MDITQDGSVLKLAGRLDIRGADKLRAALRDFTSAHANPALDLSQVESCDTAALQLIHSARITVQNAGGRFALAGLSEAVAQASSALGLPLPTQPGGFGNDA